MASNISPETIFVTKDKIVKLADFDFAKYGKYTIDQSISRGYIRIQKPYTAPEVLVDFSTASTTSDIYALDVLWYFLACLPTQNPKFDPKDAETLIDALLLPEAACALMKKLVAQELINRPQRIVEVANELKKLREISKQDDKSKLSRKFWEQLLKLAKERGMTTHIRRSPTDDHWLDASFSKPGFTIEYQLYALETGINLVIDASEKDLNKHIIDRLYALREHIEADFGSSLEWTRNNNSRRSNIQFVMKDGGIRTDESKWPAIQERMITAMSSFSTVLAHYLESATSPE